MKRHLIWLFDLFIKSVPFLFGVMAVQILFLDWTEFVWLLGFAVGIMGYHAIKDLRERRRRQRLLEESFGKLTLPK